MRLVQFIDIDGDRRVGRVEPDGATLRPLRQVRSTYELAMAAIDSSDGLVDAAARLLDNHREDYGRVIEERRILAPLDHPDPAHCFVTGTGLTHLGSAEARDRMHQQLNDTGAQLTDSMKIFKMGLENGKPADGAAGVQPEWFYKGDGSCVVPPEAPLERPQFAWDGGEETEIAGLYVIDPTGTPRRLGFALGNEYSDHVMERENYLFLAHSKLRQCSFGPELLPGFLPQDVRGVSRIRRAADVLWEKPFLSGEANMSHTIANLEHHHFKYAMFRQPGNVHIHFFGAASVSTADGFVAEAGDVFEIECETFGRPLRNAMAAAGSDQVDVKTL